VSKRRDSACRHRCFLYIYIALRQLRHCDEATHEGYILIRKALRIVDENRMPLAFGLAVLLHLLFLLLFTPLSQLLALPVRQFPADAEPPSLAFEFVDQPDAVPTERPPEETPFLSDRNALARDESAFDTDSPLPESSGISDFSRDASTSEARQNSSAETTKGETGEPSLDFASLLSASGSPSPGGSRESIYGTPALPPPSARMENRKGSARELGSFQLSTYEWDFAPYMKYLKQLIESNISPPPAFTHYGLMEGRTWVTFRILRDGRLEALKVIRHEGSEGTQLLSETSVRAVTNSVDFKPLPDHFPDEFLEISGLFEYILHKSGRR